ncbi:YbaK/EbsC family protein [Rhodovibrionaceae bacterium A322]
MSDGLKTSAQRVQDALSAQGLDLTVKEFPAGTRTAEDAAAAIGCSVAQIAKSLIFRGKESNASVLVVASGANRVDEKKVSALLGEKIGRADADFVRDKTGFAIGGVPPLAHKEAPKVLLDEDLLALGEIWAAAGTPQSVFCLQAEDLPRVTGGAFANLRKD